MVIDCVLSNTSNGNGSHYHTGSTTFAISIWKCLKEEEEASKSLDRGLVLNGFTRENVLLFCKDNSMLAYCGKMINTTGNL